MLIIQRLFYVHIIMHCILNGHYVTSCHWACIYHICLYVIWLFVSFPLAIRVYRQIKNVAMVTSLQHIKVNLKEGLLLHFTVTLTGNWGQEFTGGIYCHVHKQLQFGARFIPCLLYARSSATGTYLVCCVFY